MRNVRLTVAIAMIAGTAPAVWATNGDNLIGVGPVSRAMGGVGVAAPQDSVTAIFINPAAMNVCPCGVQSETVFGGTLFDPTVDATISTPMGVYRGTSQHEPFVIPAVGVTAPINDQWRFGLGAYGISGLGVDYRNMGWDLDGDPSNGYEGDVYTRIEVMKFSPMLSYQVNEELALGVALQAAYNNLDLARGGTHDYSYGAQLGAVYSLGRYQFGASYTTPQKSTHDRVYNFDAFSGDTRLDSLSLEAPQAFIAGAAASLTKDLLVELNYKFYNWADAEGYGDFDWKDQNVIALGAQYMATEDLILRAGFNWGENPVRSHNGWDPQGLSTVQGKQVPTFGYELIRTIGFPAIVENHLTFGFGYRLTDSLTLNFDYMHAFEETIRNASMGEAIVFESSLSENSYGISLAWQFE